MFSICPSGEDAGVKQHPVFPTALGDRHRGGEAVLGAQRVERLAALDQGRGQRRSGLTYVRSQRAALGARQRNVELPRDRLQCRGARRGGRRDGERRTRGSYAGRGYLRMAGSGFARSVSAARPEEEMRCLPTTS